MKKIIELTHEVIKDLKFQSTTKKRRVPAKNIFGSDRRRKPQYPHRSAKQPKSKKIPIKDEITFSSVLLKQVYPVLTELFKTTQEFNPS